MKSEQSVMVKKNYYRDSVFLMDVSKKLERLSGVVNASVVMGTAMNKEILKSVGFSGFERATPNDLIIAVQAENAEACSGHMKTAGKMLEAIEDDVSEKSFFSTVLAVEKSKDSNLALISIPGKFVRMEAEKALNAGLHVMVFSDNVPVEDEIYLKDLAIKKDLLLMGPECGTSIVNGKVLGFGNKVNSGCIGIVGSSGTGIQEVSCIISNYSGISHAIGVGGRDLSKEIGARMTLFALEKLKHDPETEVVVIVGKKCHPSVEKKLLGYLSSYTKDSVVLLIGSGLKKYERLDGKIKLVVVDTLEDAAYKALELLNVRTSAHRKNFEKRMDKLAKSEKSKIKKSQKYVKGLFSGGTFCQEAYNILSKHFKGISTNPREKRGHVLIDMGAEEFTKGRPHPMIDYTLRCEKLFEEAIKPATVVMLFDIVLGYGSNPDPAEEIMPAVKKIREFEKKKNIHVPLVCNLCGTAEDFQGYSVQKKKLEKAGILVFLTCAQASKFAVKMLSR